MVELLLLTQQCCDNEYNSQHIFEHNHSALMAETSHKNEIKSNVRYVLHPRNAFFYFNKFVVAKPLFPSQSSTHIYWYRNEFKCSYLGITEYRISEPSYHIIRLLI